MSDFRLGLIGAGPWGRRCIATISRLPGVVLARVASKNPETASLVGPDCKLSPTWESVAFARDLDGIMIATPGPTHAAITRAAIAGNLPAFVEKPLTQDPSQAMEILDLARRRRGLVMVDHIFLFHSGYEEIKKRLPALGPVRRMISSGGNRGPFRAGTSPLWDYGPHDVSVALDLMGDASVSIQAVREKSETVPAGLGENFKLEMTFGSGARAESRIGNLFPARERRFEFHFSGRALVLDDGPKTLALHPLGPGGQLGPGENLPISPELPLDRAIKAFVAAVRSGEKDLSGLKLGVDVVALLSECERQLGR